MKGYKKFKLFFHYDNAEDYLWHREYYEDQKNVRRIVLLIIKNFKSEI